MKFENKGRWVKQISESKQVNEGQLKVSDLKKLHDLLIEFKKEIEVSFPGTTQEQKEFALWCKELALLSLEYYDAYK